MPPLDELRPAECPCQLRPSKRVLEYQRPLARLEAYRNFLTLLDLLPHHRCFLTRTLTGRGERMRASGPVQRDVGRQQGPSTRSRVILPFRWFTTAAQALPRGTCIHRVWSIGAPSLPDSKCTCRARMHDSDPRTYRQEYTDVHRIRGVQRRPSGSPGPTAPTSSIAPSRRPHREPCAVSQAKILASPLESYRRR